MQISLLRNPIPYDFGGHILQLCTTISSQQATHRHPDRVAWMFEKLSVMLASCVLLDCARFRKGRVDELFANYEKFFDFAMGEYLELHHPCSFVGAEGGRRCMLVKARHQPKGMFAESFTSSLSAKRSQPVVYGSRTFSLARQDGSAL